jgi:hypothetical protein
MAKSSAVKNVFGFGLLGMTLVAAFLMAGGVTPAFADSLITCKSSPSCVKTQTNPIAGQEPYSCLNPTFTCSGPNPTCVSGGISSYFSRATLCAGNGSFSYSCGATSKTCCDAHYETCDPGTTVGKSCTGNDGLSHPTGDTQSCGSASCGGTQLCENGSWDLCNYASSDGDACSTGNACTTGETCDTGSCTGGVNNPVNGGWSAWSSLSCGTFSSCANGEATQSQTCTQTHTCDNPTASCGGSTCSGPSTQTTVNTQACPQICVPGSHQPCNVAANTCGGTQICASDGLSWGLCSVPPVVNGGWSAWSGPLNCSACANGSQTCAESRTCDNPSPSCGGNACSGSSSQTVTQTCSSPPVSCGALFSCTDRSGKGTCCVYGCDATQVSGCAVAPPNVCVGSNGQRYAAGGTQSCVSGANSCGQTNNGTETCGSGGSWSACSASTPANPANFGNACNSSANNCGDKNSGTIKCDGTTCNASAPADRASCNSIGGKGYVCQNNSSCVPVASGATYTTTSTCQADCPLPSIGGKGYVCQNNTSCVPVASGATYTTTSTCQAACGGTVNPSLSVSLSASPSTAAVPFSSSLGATVQSSDNASTVNYTFFWNCNYAGTSVSVAITSCGALPAPVPGSCVSNQNGAKCDGILSHAKTAVSPPYQAAGSYHPLVIVEQGSFPPARGSAVVTATVPVVGGSGYNCQNNVCVFAASGATYTTTSSCQAACGPITGSQPSITITASHSSIILGASSTITWVITNTQPTTSCTLQGQVVGTSGSVTVTPRVTTQYILSCLTPGPGNPAPAQAAITITVNQNPGLKEVAP